MKTVTSSSVIIMFKPFQCLVSLFELVRTKKANSDGFVVPGNKVCRYLLLWLSMHSLNWYNSLRFFQSSFLPVIIENVNWLSII